MFYDVLNIDANVEILTGKYKQQNCGLFPPSLSSNPLTVDHNRAKSNNCEKRNHSHSISSFVGGANKHYKLSPVMEVWLVVSTPLKNISQLG